jgi:regulator of ribonuclease activity A
MSIPFTTTADIYDKNGESSCRIPSVAWRSYGGVASFSGTAVTVECRDDNSRVNELLNTPGDGRILVVDAGGSTRYAFCGDQLAKAAERNNWGGIVLYGCVRDTAELRQVQVGIVAIGTTPRKTEKRGQGKVDVRVRISEADCYPGDYVYCDDDGVIFMNPPNVFRG